MFLGSLLPQRAWQQPSGDRSMRMLRMSERDNGHAIRIDQFFAGLGARGDQWRTLVERAEAWCDGSGSRAEVEAVLAEMTAVEEFHAYPGRQLLGALRDH